MRLQFLVPVLLVAAGLSRAAMIPAERRAQAPEFTAANLDGHPVRLSDYKGNVVLLNFWATWCGGCKLEIPWYMEFDKTYRSSGLTVVGVSLDDEGSKVVKPFVDQKKIAYPIVIGNESIAKEYAVESMPVTLLIDREGRVAMAHSGVVDKAEVERDIRELLTERKL